MRAARSTLRDEQTEVIGKLSELLDVEVIEHADGTAQVTYGYGRPLVIGRTAYPLAVQSAPVTGLAQIYSDVSNTTGEIAGGRSPGSSIPATRSSPAIARASTSWRTRWCRRSTRGTTRASRCAGVDAPVFFQPLASAAGAASLMTMNAAVVADPSLVAAGGIAATPGDNTGARALAGLRDARVLSGGTATFSDFYTDIVYEAGEARSFALSEARTHGEVVRQIQNLRDSVSGVSLDEEAAAMMRFQRAYEASARFFTTVNQTLDTLLNLGR